MTNPFLSPLFPGSFSCCWLLWWILIRGQRGNSEGARGILVWCRFNCLSPIYLSHLLDFSLWPDSWLFVLSYERFSEALLRLVKFRFEARLWACWLWDQCHFYIPQEQDQAQNTLYQLACWWIESITNWQFSQYWIIESCWLFESATANPMCASQLLVSWLIRCMEI